MTYNSEIVLNEVALNVKDIIKEKDFYTSALGMTVLEETTQHITLGTGLTPLVKLIQTTDNSAVSSSYGLYHLAILLPTRADLANLLKHFVDTNISLVGASDHGYSEAIYLEDPEGNGIEVYRDKEMSEWDVKSSGRIIGITEQLDVQSLYDEGKSMKEYHLPKGTIMGHVHLSVVDNKVSSSLLQSIFDIQEKFSVPTASWIASGDYHHHLAVNEWGGGSLNQRHLNEKGLAYLAISAQSKIYFNKVIDNLIQNNIKYEYLSDSSIEFVDENGINIQLRL